MAITSLRCRTFDTGSYRLAKSVVAAFFIPPIALFMIFMPILGPKILIPPIQRQVYNHTCDSYDTHVVLDGRGFKQPLSVANTARFYGRNSQQPLFTFNLEQSNASSAVFQFHEFNTDAATLPNGFMPTLRSISYNFDNRRLTGTCNNTTVSCLGGVFDMDRLTLDISSNVTGTTVHYRSQSENKQWLRRWNRPSLILRSLIKDGSLDDKILQTAVTKVFDCTSLKVCISGSGGGLVGPDMFAPLGIIFTKHASYSSVCSTRSG